MQLSDKEITAIYELLETCPDGWQQMSQIELEAYGEEKEVENPYEFATKCFLLNIGDPNTYGV